MLAASIPDGTPRRPAMTRAEADAALLDPNATVEQKLEVHRMLRFVENAYSPAAVQELVRIATSATDEKTRADVWRTFAGRTRQIGRASCRERV